VFAQRSDEDIQVIGFAPTYDRQYRSIVTPGGGGIKQVGFPIIPVISDADTINQQQDTVQWKYNYIPRILKYIGLQPEQFTYDGTNFRTYQQ